MIGFNHLLYFSQYINALFKFSFDLIVVMLMTFAIFKFYFYSMVILLQVARRWLISINGTLYKNLTIFVPDIHNTTTRGQICATLNLLECDHWVECCTSAEHCCQQMVDEHQTKDHTVSHC